jgi:hypothetical protein
MSEGGDWRLPAALALLVLNVLDAWITLHVIHLGIAREGNVVARFLIEHGLIWYVKIGVPLLIIAGIMYTENRVFTARPMFAIVGLYSVVVLWNAVNLVRY